MNTDQVFQLVDRVLPFEACLFHQILPLSIEEGKLHLGMVMLDDVAALEYARRMIGYQNYSLVPQSISSEAHHKTLTAYLNYNQTHPKTERFTKAPEPEKPSSHAQEPLPTPVLELEKPNLHEKETLVLEEDPAEFETEPEPSQVPISNLSSNPLPDLAVSTRYSEEPIALLSQLPPARLLQELLGRVLCEGIGRLYFERQARHGRILWSQNGILQASIEGVPLPKFQALLDELKELTHLPPKLVTQVREVEIERLYQRDRVLLRLRLMPTEMGEQATLQVLRGAALKFHQRQQVTNFNRDAHTIAQKLYEKMDELLNAQAASSFITDQSQSDVVPALDQALQIVEQHLSQLRTQNGHR
ncbi:hypothetical protein Q2T42_30660 [Leptolyngbya boryana CZ1]|uniref:Type II secretion system protein GspE N-terminal domain-containing protein n=1 Tax=Leptolyngbya boryana CZ1 TaxID=3060204 RepID=A0AA96WXU0_LEPBY|nr:MULTISPECIES: hypothetical protein [Leptolyngbya]MBN8560944.1 hypothetical protein [Leptolyngbya sp. UWPOB_LEPTO1]WNZ46154.1 hypothetical protein Q2T42_30660 [Leptolyngbya boryana CZ1]